MLGDGMAGSLEFEFAGGEGVVYDAGGDAAEGGLEEWQGGGDVGGFGVEAEEFLVELGLNDGDEERAEGGVAGADEQEFGVEQAHDGGEFLGEGLEDGREGGEDGGVVGGGGGNGGGGGESEVGVGVCQ